ncbi:MAG TPA: hypothetical protein VGF59_32770 [Bryobacteraceae bacterium]
MLKIIVLSALLAAVADCQREPQSLPTTATERVTPIMELITIDQAAAMYYSWLKRLPASLKQLGSNGSKVADAHAADLISAKLASGEHNGYRFTLTPTKAGWIVRAVPLFSSSAVVQTTYTIESRVTPKKSRRR